MHTRIKTKKRKLPLDLKSGEVSPNEENKQEVMLVSKGYVERP